MTKGFRISLPPITAGIVLVFIGVAIAQQPDTPALPNMGQDLTPLMPRGSTFVGLNPGLSDYPNWLASQAVTSVASPDGNTLLVLTSGFNRIFKAHPQVPFGTPGLASWYLPDSSEYVFIYDISTGTPVLKQVLPIRNSTYNGIVFDPTGLAFYVAGGPDDIVHIITLSASTGLWGDTGKSLVLGHHNQGAGFSLTAPGPVAINSQVGVLPCAAGVAISKDGKTLVVVNYFNDSITVFHRGYGGYTNWSQGTEVDLRPGKSNPAKAGVPGGEYPFWGVIKGSGSSAVAYISSVRDREIVLVSLGRVPAVTARIPVNGQPNKMTLNAAQSLLYVAEDQSDTVDIIDTATNTIRETIPVIATLLPSRLAHFKGANPNSVTLSPDEKLLYVTDGNLNCISVITLSGTSKSDSVVGLIPTGWYPNSTSFSKDGTMVYAVNSKSPTGSNDQWCYGGYGPPNYPSCLPANEYNPQLTKSGLQSFPLPDSAQLNTLTAQVVKNNRFASTESEADSTVMAEVRKHIQHVIFILKENRTYDQVLGDLKTLDGKKLGRGDPTLTEFGENITPNLHNLARTFVTLDNFLDTAEISVDGWLWSTSAQAPDVVQRQWPLVYGYRGLSVDSEGTNRFVNVAIPTLAERVRADPLTPADPDLLPGQTNVFAPDGPNNEINTGYLWDSALRAGLTVRNYGFFIDTARYNTPVDAIPLSRNPFGTGTIQAYPSSASLAPYTDLYFRGFDNAYPDFYRYAEWVREFNSSYAAGGLPALTLVRLMHDHTGNWLPGPGGTPPAAIDGVNTPDLQVADNDYAVGMLVQRIANSIYANNTLIFVVEDDAQDGGDHIDSHRTTAYVAGAYVKQGSVVSTAYNTIDFLRTMEEVLGLPPMNLNDALGHPMTDVFNVPDLLKGTPSPWSFTAAPSLILYNTRLLLPPKPASMRVPKPAHNAKYWARVTKGMDFTDADRVDPADFNRVLWKGMMGNKPYPANLKQKNARIAKADSN